MATRNKRAHVELYCECRRFTIITFRVFLGAVANAGFAKKVEGARFAAALTAFTSQSQCSPGKLKGICWPAGEHVGFA